MNIYNSGENVIIVDYAHNRLTLEEFLKSVETDYSDYIINIVIGAAGKNHLRREDIGKLCGTYAHHLYLTEEAVSYTHLDVYKRQERYQVKHL